MREMKRKVIGVVLCLLIAWPLPLGAQTSPAQLAYELAQEGYGLAILEAQAPLVAYMEETEHLVSFLNPFESHLVFYQVDVQPGLYQAFLELPEGMWGREWKSSQWVHEWAQGLGQNLTDRELAQAINDCLIRQVAYDYGAFARYQAGLPVNSRVFSADGAILDGQAVCDGYAGAVLLMCREVGLPCIKVKGQARGVNHAWNLVYLRDEGMWLHLDVTSNDYEGLFDPGQIQSQPAFLLSDAGMDALGMTWDPHCLDMVRTMSYPAWVPQALEALVGAGVVVGYGDGSYGEDRQLSRQELAALLVRLQGVAAKDLSEKSTFSDVDPWAEGAVAYCQDQGLLVGYPDGTFGGQKPVRKQEWAAIVLRLYDPEGPWEWERVEAQAEALGLIHPGRRSGIGGDQALRADIFDSLYRSWDLLSLVVAEA